jgi:hypothetical protein
MPIALAIPWLEKLRITFRPSSPPESYGKHSHLNRIDEKPLDFESSANVYCCVLKGPRELLRIIGMPLVCAAMFSIAGGHWAVLQTIAWGQMLREYSQGSTIAEAVSKTFDGNHPCALCCKVKQGRQREEKVPATTKLDKKAELFTTSVNELSWQPPFCLYHYPGLTDLIFSGRSDAPPQPVPRTFVS